MYTRKTFRLIPVSRIGKNTVSRIIFCTVLGANVWGNEVSDNKPAGESIDKSPAGIDVLTRQLTEPAPAQLEYDPPAEAALELIAYGTNALAPLIAVLDHEQADARRLAAWALGEIGDRRAASALAQRLEDENGFVRAAAETALIRISVPGSPVLQDALGSGCVDARLRAVRALGVIGDIQAAEKLTELVADDDVEVRCAAVEALGRLGGLDVAGRLMPLLESDDEITRRRAVWALKEIFSRADSY